MSRRKRTLDVSHLMMYAPYALQLQDSHGVIMTLEGFDLYAPNDKFIIAERIGWKIDEVKPVLRPLREYANYEDILDEFSVHSEEQFQIAFFSSLGRSLNALDTINCTIAELMYKYHLDLYGLIDDGLAVDKNTVKKLF